MKKNTNTSSVGILLFSIAFVIGIIFLAVYLPSNNVDVSNPVVHPFLPTPSTTPSS